MKRLAALVLVLLLAVPAAHAGTLPIGGGLKSTPAPAVVETPAPQTDEPAPARETVDILADPKARYANFADPDDPASVWFLRMLDSVNDEASLAPEGMAVRRDDYAVDADGAAVVDSTMFLYETEYGYVLEMRIDEEYPGMVIYAFPDVVVVQYAGTALTDPSGYEVSSDMLAPDQFLNTYDPAETLLAVRAEGDGFAYLTDSGDGRVFEYLTDAGLKFYEMRSYGLDADGEMRLTQYARVEIVEAPALPQAVVDAME